MFERGTISKIAAVVTIIALKLIAIPSCAQPSAAMDGTVLRADRNTPSAGATVHVADKSSGAFVESAPTADDGSFHLDALPGSEYRIAVEADGGLYLVPAPLALNDGETRRVVLAINPNAQLAPGSTGTLSFRENPVTATLLLLGGLLILGYFIDELASDNKTLIVTPTAP